MVYQFLLVKDWISLNMTMNYSTRSLVDIARFHPQCDFSFLNLPIMPKSTNLSLDHSGDIVNEFSWGKKMRI